MSVVVSGLLSRAKAFWPMLAGIICARTALIVACYGSYASTDDGIFTDGSMFVTCALFIVALLIFSRSRRELGATAVQWIMVGIIVAAEPPWRSPCSTAPTKLLRPRLSPSALPAPWPCRCACSTGCAACAAPTK
ncbi:MAG: hypothetical protein ACLSGS_06395 [Adlercreutzia sp.]